MTQECIVVKHLGISYAVKIRDIFFVESNDKRIMIHTESDRVECPGQISDYEGLPGFFRCHRGYVVNMEHVARYSASSITLSNKQEILMSRRRYAAFVTAHSERVGAFPPSCR